MAWGVQTPSTEEKGKAQHRCSRQGGPEQPVWCMGRRHSKTQATPPPSGIGPPPPEDSRHRVTRGLHGTRSRLPTARQWAPIRQGIQLALGIRIRAHPFCIFPCAKHPGLCQAGHSAFGIPYHTTPHHTTPHHTTPHHTTPHHTTPHHTTPHHTGVPPPRRGGVHTGLVRPRQGACHTAEGPPGPGQHDGVGVAGAAPTPASGTGGSAAGAPGISAVAKGEPTRSSRLPLSPPRPTHIRTARTQHTQPRPFTCTRG